jgi:hypothetical protein
VAANESQEAGRDSSRAESPAGHQIFERPARQPQQGSCCQAMLGGDDPLVSPDTLVSEHTDPAKRASNLGQLVGFRETIFKMLLKPSRHRMPFPDEPRRQPAVGGQRRLSRRKRDHGASARYPADLPHRLGAVIRRNVFEQVHRDGYVERAIPKRQGSNVPNQLIWPELLASASRGIIVEVGVNGGGAPAGWQQRRDPVRAATDVKHKPELGSGAEDKLQYWLKAYEVVELAGPQPSTTEGNQDVRDAARTNQ